MKNPLITNAQEKEQKGDLQGALSDYQNALNQDPSNLVIHTEIGNLLAMLGNYDEAVKHLKITFKTFPNNIDVLNGICFCLCEIGNQHHDNRNYDLAEHAFLEAVNLNPTKSEYLFNLGNSCYAQEKYGSALKYYNQSLVLSYEAETLSSIGNALRSLGRYEESKEMYGKALRQDKTLLHAEIELTHLMQSLCNWENIAEHFETIKKDINSNNPGLISPFTVLSMPHMGCEEQLKVSSRWAKQYTLKPLPLKKNESIKNKLSIAYLSSDFRLHPLYFLIIDVLKSHNKEKFEITLYYSGKEEISTAQNDFRKIAANFINISGMSDYDAAQLISSSNTDILVDLSGFTKKSRSMLAAYKPARVHISWLGFAGTMGYFNSSPLYDHILADRYLIPEASKKYYAENVIYHPNCYQPNIEKRAKLFPVDRKSYGFSDKLFIYASFGQSIKITEAQFTLWLKILKNTSNSILWLLESNDICMKNLLAYAEKNEVDPLRICFAKKVSLEEHINRHQIIDLFLDTYPYNAHTSTSDAIWAQCPVLTKSGPTFASRVAGSILTEIGCPELIVESDEAYYEEAIKYATDKQSLELIKNKVIRGKEGSALFKPQLFAKNLEEIYSDLISS